MIGIMGCGVVGDAMEYALLAKGYSSGFVLYDPPRGLQPSFDELLLCEIIFICVPSPMMEGGAQDLSIIEDVVRQLWEKHYKGVVCIKSTVTPRNIKYLISLYGHQLHITTNPEFLTERQARQDCIESPFIVVGGSADDTQVLRDLYTTYWKGSRIFLTSPAAAMMVKYMINGFLGVKIAYMNECRKIWDDVGDVSWNVVVAAFALDERVGPSHMQVPGPDGRFGFGGKCFPKDIRGMADMAEAEGVVHHVISAAWETNLEVRESREWESIPGAVTKEEKDAE